MIDQMNQLEHLVGRAKTSELAETLDEIFKTQFTETSPQFKSDYLNELTRLRKRDALSSQITELKKIRSDLTKYKKKREEYELLKENSSKIKDIYEAWLKDSKNPFSKNMDSFIDNAFFQLNELDSEFLEHCTSTKIKQMIRFAKSGGQNPNHSKHSLIEPDYPSINYDILNHKDIDISYSTKTDSELLEELGRTYLSQLVFITCNALDTGDTNTLKMFLMFSICHATCSYTKGKEFARTHHLPKNWADEAKDEWRTKSKTFQKSFTALYKEKEDVLNEISDLLKIFPPSN